MKLSVLVLTFNQEKTIAQTLDSILMQEHSYDYEILVGDDASKDNTPKIIEEYANKFPHIIKPILRKQNLGVVKNYFDLVEASEGEYIMGCAGDDYWLPGKIDVQIKFMENHSDFGLCYSDALIYNPQSLTFTGILKGDTDNTPESLLYCNHIPAVTICYRRKLITEYIQKINPVQKDWLMEDYPIIIWMSINSRIGYIPLSLSVYQLSPNSISHSENYTSRLLFERSVLSIRKFFVRKLYSKSPLNYKINQLKIINDLQLSQVLNFKSKYQKLAPYYLRGDLKQTIKLGCLILFPKQIMKKLIK